MFPSGWIFFGVLCVNQLTGIYCFVFPRHRIGIVPIVPCSLWSWNHRKTTIESSEHRKISMNLYGFNNNGYGGSSKPFRRKKHKNHGPSNGGGNGGASVNHPQYRASPPSTTLPNKSNPPHPSSVSNKPNDSPQDELSVNREPSISIPLHDDIDTSDMSIVEYVNYLYRRGNGDIKASIIQPLKRQQVEASFIGYLKQSPMAKSLLKIKYSDFCRSWKRWIRESRGVILRFDEKKQQFICDKMMLLRGAEVLTNLHVQANITESQDMTLSDDNRVITTTNITSTPAKEPPLPRHFLDPSQQDTVNRLLNSQPIDAYLSFKSDGALIAISLYKRGTTAGNFYQSVLSNYGDEFAKGIVTTANQLNLPFIPIIGSQGTISLAGDMQTFAATAILEGMCELSHEQVKTLATKHTPLQLLQHSQYGKKFFDKLLTFYNHCSDKGHPCSQSNHTDVSGMTLSFEAFCRNRQDSWPNARTHTELSIGYPFSAMRFLGGTFYYQSEDQHDIGPPPVYKAHFQLPDACQVSGFDQPLCWKVSHAKEVEALAKDLSRSIMGELNDDEFIHLHPPYTPNTTSITHVQRRPQQLDYEGWILYRELSDGTLDYSKIKSEEYYKCHKFHINNIPILLSIAKSSRNGIHNIFPLAKVTQDICEDLNKKLLNAIIELKGILTGKVPPSNTITQDASYYKGEYQKLLESLPNNARIAYQKPQMTPEGQMKLLLNTQNQYCENTIFRIFQKQFKVLRSDMMKDGVLKGLIMLGKPWESIDKIKNDIDSVVESVLQSSWNDLDDNDEDESKSKLDKNTKAGNGKGDTEDDNGDSNSKSYMRQQRKKLKDFLKYVGRLYTV